MSVLSWHGPLCGVSRNSVSTLSHRAEVTETCPGRENQRILLSGPRWYGVFFLPDDSLCVVSAKSPSQRVDHLLSSDVGCSAYPSGCPCSDSADARTADHTRWYGEK